jgi:effector-binding domain-containing protein
MSTPLSVSIPDSPPSIRRLGSFSAATLVTRGPYWKLSPTFARLRSWLAAASVEPADLALALFFDDPAVTPAELCRYSVCYPVGADDAGRLAATPPPADGVELSAAGDDAGAHDVYEITTFPSTDAAVVEYAGPADQSPAVYDRLERWIRVLGLEADGPPRERYLAEPGSLGRGMMHVEVQQPVKPGV